MAVISFKCPNCDGELIFQPATQKYKCEYCASVFSQQELDGMNRAEATEQRTPTTEEQKDAAGAAQEAEALTYSCPSCGAEIVTDKTTASTFCYYCHNPVILGKRLEGKYLPDRIIPFTVTREQAEKGFLEFVSKKKFVPKAFFNKKQIESLTGVYFPYWSYDVELAGKMDAEGKKIRTWRTGNEEYTETQVYRIVREGDVSLKNYTENALRKANAKLAQNVMPFQFDKMKPFHMGYLSGFFAEKRDIEKVEMEKDVQSAMRQNAERLVKESAGGYSTLHVNNMSFHARREEWSYCLLPVWTITYKGKNDKIYYYSMNGQTGKVCGELPVAYGKLAAFSAMVSALILIFGMLGGYFLW